MFVLANGEKISRIIYLFLPAERCFSIVSKDSFPVPIFEFENTSNLDGILFFNLIEEINLVNTASLFI